MLTKVSMNLVIGPLIIMAIIGLNSPSKCNCASQELEVISLIDAVKENLEIAKTMEVLEDFIYLNYLK